MGILTFVFDGVSSRNSKIELVFHNVENVTLSEGDALSIILLHSKISSTQEQFPPLFFTNPEIARHVHLLLKNDATSKEHNTKHIFLIKHMDRLFDIIKTKKVFLYGGVTIQQYLGMSTV